MEKEGALEIKTKTKEMVNIEEVIVIDIQMPFLSMVEFMIKWAVASIPAIFILIFLFSLFTTGIKPVLP